MKSLLDEIKTCQVCASFFEHAPRPVVQLHPASKILIIGQAPGSKVHASGIPWDDPSGNRLRSWLNVDKETFYDTETFGLLPMGFCYPGKGKSGDLPPRPECAPLWHTRIFQELKEIKLTLLVGQYAQQYYLKENFRKTLTETVKSYSEYLPEFLPLPHPSPRNQFWMRKNPWFETDIVPLLQQKVKANLA